MPVDLYASESHYLRHLAATWAALGDDRGNAWTPHGLLGRAAAEGLAAREEGSRQGPPAGDRPCLVASYKDHRLARAAGRPVVYVEHGAGQSYGGSPEAAAFPGYSGGRDHDGTVLFLTPGEEPAARWRAAYPAIPAVPVGCPKLDARHLRPARARARTLAGATVAVSFHFDCLPGDVQVSGPATKMAGSRWFEGQLVVVRTAAGYELPVTPNHPVLTPSGWVRAGDLREGDEVISGRSRERMKLRVGPDDVDVPASIEEVARAAKEAGSVLPVSMPHAAEHLDGEGLIHGEVYVVSTDGLLRNDAYAAALQPSPESPLLPTDPDLAQLTRGSPLGEFLLGAHCSTHGLMGGLDESPTLAIAHPLPSLLRAGAQRNLDARFPYPLDDRALRDAVGLGEFRGAHPVPVRTPDFADIRPILETTEPHRLTLGPVQPAVPEQPNDGRLRLAEFVGDAASSHAVEVTRDHVVGITRQFFAGHVYDLHTTAGWFVANNLVVHNCALVQETRSAWRHWEPSLRPVVAALRDAGAHVLGHAHPRLWRHAEPVWRRAGAEPVAELDEVLDRADVFAADNTSALPEAASCGVPLVWVDHPHYRRDVWHGGRFWAWPAGQVSCGEPSLLPSAFVEALADAPEVRASRQAMLDSVYLACDGRAAERAAAAIRKRYSAL